MQKKPSTCAVWMTLDLRRWRPVPPKTMPKVLKIGMEVEATGEVVEITGVAVEATGAAVEIVGVVAEATGAAVEVAGEAAVATGAAMAGKRPDAPILPEMFTLEDFGHFIFV